MPKYTIRGMVRERRNENDCQQWDYETTEKECLKADRDISKQSQNPAPRFREEIRNKNKSYIRQWVWGCHFEWLNPRKEK